ncbi:MAG: CDP-alcohol phosphatidyltransferase family protein [Actinomycetes bacterium]
MLVRRPARGAPEVGLLAGPGVGLVGQVAVLALLAQAVELSAAGWVAGLVFGLVTNVSLASGLLRFGAGRLGPANAVTLVRAVLVGGVTALVVDAFFEPASVPVLMALATVALLLDAVDGWVARRTGTSSRLGWRFDQETDAFLILVLSVYVAVTTVWWVLAIGLFRYLFALAGYALPWMRGTLPARYWGKVVAAVQGVTLTVAAAGVLPRPWTLVALAVSAALLVESFTHSVRWLWRRRPVAPEQPARGAPARTGTTR